MHDSCLHRYCGCRRTPRCTPRIVLQRLDGFRTIVTSLAVHDSQLPRVGGFGRLDRCIVPERHGERFSRCSVDERTRVRRQTALIPCPPCRPLTLGRRQKLTKKTLSGRRSPFRRAPLLDYQHPRYPSRGFLTSLVSTHPGTSCYRD